MIRSRRNEKEMKEHEEEQRSQGFFIKYKKNEDCFAIFLTLNSDLTLAITHRPQTLHLGLTLEVMTTVTGSEQQYQCSLS